MKPASSQSSPVLALVLVTALCGGVVGCGGAAGDSGPRPSGAAKDEAAPIGGLGRRASLLNHGPRERRRVALTFDADMTQAKLAELRASGAAAASDSYDRRVVRELERTRTPATIFMAGL
ncbi:MAG TPA: hypothetical protein VK387_05345 [Thermoleophilaceae bacterium]|nr:hypothetical protein [Thermoleophilaceae bacterium]